METLLGSFIGFLSFSLTSHPNSPLGKRVPTKKIRNISFTPELKVSSKNRVFHFHHWIIFTSLYIATLYIHRGFLQSDIFQGFMLGSIAQGLTYEDRFMFMYQATGEKIRGKKLILPTKE